MAFKWALMHNVIHVDWRQQGGGGGRESPPHQQTIHRPHESPHTARMYGFSTLCLLIEKVLFLTNNSIQLIIYIHIEKYVINVELF